MSNRQPDTRAGSTAAPAPELPGPRSLKNQLASSRAHAEAVLNTVVDAIISIDSRGIVQAFNPAAEQMFGYPATEIIGRNVRCLMPQPHRDRHDGYMQSYLSTGNKKIIGIGREVQAQRRDGSVFPMELAISEVQLDGEHHFTGVIRDISERKRAEQRLQQQREETEQLRERLAATSQLSTLGEMAAGIAHEINQPLTAITTYADICQRWVNGGKPDHPKLPPTLAEISEQARQASAIIEGMRSLVERRSARRELCDLNLLAQQTLRLSEPDARRHRVALQTTLADTALPIVADPVQIQQVLLNLIRNAIEATREARPAAAAEAEPDPGAVILLTRANNGYVTAAVSDRGPGIDDHTGEKLFDPFFTTKPVGMGMGLAICRSIITAHAGDIGFESSSRPDSATGATLYFTLPLAVPDGAGSEPGAYL